MSLPLHQYVIAGHKRTEIVKYLAFVAVTVAPFVTWLAQCLVNSQGTIVPIGLAALLYAGLFWIFNKHGWKWVSKLINTPDVSGQWDIKGETRDEDGNTRFEWSGVIDINQTWTEIGIHLKTKQSSSNSDAATLLIGHNGNSTLTYSYRNDPRLGESDLKPHIGFCRLVFNQTDGTAEGEYFNAGGRYSFGQMTLSKVKDNGPR